VNIAFFGSGAFGVASIEAIARAYRLVGVVTQPDRPAGRGKRLTPTPIGAWCVENAPGAPLLKPEHVNEPSMVDQIRAWPADLIFVIAFGQKIGPALLESRTALNLHGSRLPRWRGAAPIHHAILAGDSVTGNSVIAVGPRMDAGDVYGLSERPIEPDQTAGDLHDLLGADGPELVLRVLGEIERGRAHPRAQDESRVTLAPKLSRADAWIDLARPAYECRRRINGLSPWPGVRASLGDKKMKLVRTAPEQDRPGAERLGTLVDPKRGLVRCGAGTLLRLIEVQPEGRGTMSWDDFARGAHPQASHLLVGERTCAPSGTS